MHVDLFAIILFIAVNYQHHIHCCSQFPHSTNAQTYRLDWYFFYIHCMSHYLVV